MSIRIKAGKTTISFVGDNAVLCELKDGWDVDFMDLKDGWSHHLESDEKDYMYILRVNDSGKNIKVLYFEILGYKDGQYQTCCLDPVVVWLANDRFYQGTVLQNSYPFIDDDDERDDYSVHKLEHSLIDLYRQYNKLMSLKTEGYDRFHEAEVNRLEERMRDLEEELFGR